MLQKLMQGGTKLSEVQNKELLNATEELLSLRDSSGTQLIKTDRAKSNKTKFKGGGLILYGALDTIITEINGGNNRYKNL